MNLCSLILVLLLSVFPESAAFIAKGKASYYSDRMQGHPTTSGERYDKTKFTAAHATLPLHTLVEVTNLKNGKKVVVRINDRKSRSRHSIIDLSRAAAKEIDMVRDGIGTVSLAEVKDPETGQQDKPLAVSTTAPVN